MRVFILFYLIIELFYFNTGTVTKKNKPKVRVTEIIGWGYLAPFEPNAN